MGEKDRDAIADGESGSFRLSCRVQRREEETLTVIGVDESGLLKRLQMVVSIMPIKNFLSKITLPSNFILKVITLFEEQTSLYCNLALSWETRV